MGNHIRNARLQLLATLLNTMAASSFAVGIAAPVAAVFFSQSVSVRAVAVGAILWVVPMVCLHVTAQIVLGGLRQQ